MTREEIREYVYKNLSVDSDRKELNEPAYKRLISLNSHDTELLCEILAEENITIGDTSMKDSNVIIQTDENELSPTYISMIKQIPLLTRDEEHDLAIKIKNGDVKAKEELIRRNLRLVVSIATKIPSPSTITMEDKIQDGNLGLIKAIDMFNPDLGFKFSTYATWWIRQSIYRSIYNNSEIIRKPVHYQENLKKIKRFIDDQVTVTGKVPTIEEISVSTGLSYDTVNSTLRLDKACVSLDNPLSGDEEGSTLMDIISDKENDGTLEYDDFESNDVLANEIDRTFISDYKLNAEEIEILTYFGKKICPYKKVFRDKRKKIIALNKSSLFASDTLKDLHVLELCIGERLKSLRYGTKALNIYDNERRTTICKNLEEELQELFQVINNLSDYVIDSNKISCSKISKILIRNSNKYAESYTDYLNRVYKIMEQYNSELKALESTNDITSANDLVNKMRRKRSLKMYLDFIFDCYISKISGILEKRLTKEEVERRIDVITKHCNFSSSHNIELLLENSKNLYNIETYFMNDLIFTLQKYRIMDVEELKQMVIYFNANSKRMLPDFTFSSDSYISNYKEFEKILTDLQYKDVLERRLGVNGQTYSLKEIGDEYGVTRECIRQKEKSAMNKIRNRLLPLGAYEDDPMSYSIKFHH